MKLWRDYSLGWAYLAGWLLSLVLHIHGEWWVGQYPHGNAPWGIEWYTHFWENIQSEMFQVGFLIIVATYLVFKGSPQSRDGDDEMRAQLDRIEEKLQ